MGFVSDRVKKNPVTSTAFPGNSRGNRTWNEVFGSTSKERPFNPNVTRTTDRLGGVGLRPARPYANAQKRLIQALRSNAPGSWTDDRYEQSKHFFGINYVAIHGLCRQYQQSEFMIYKKDKNHPDGKRPVTEDDPPEGDRACKPYDLVKLLEKPNNQDSFGKMMYRLGQQKLLTGTALNYMVPNILGYIHELYVIPTSNAIPQAVIDPEFSEGYYRIQPLYPYGPYSTYPTPQSSVGAPLGAQWFIRSLYPHPLLRYEGWSPLTAMRLQMDEFEDISRSRWYKMRRSINASAVLNMDEIEGATVLPEEEIDRIHTEWEVEFQGPENHGRLIVCPPGGKLEEWGRAPSEMDYIESFSQLADFIMGGGFGITKQAAGMIEDASYSTLYASLKQLHVLTVQPDLDDFAADFTRTLAPFFGDDLIIEIKAKRIDDHEIVFQKIDKGIQAKCITKNQVLKMLELPVTRETWGEDIAGDPSPNELKQQQQQASAGMGEPGGAGPGPGAPSPQPPPLGKQEEKEPKEVTQSRPTPGPLGAGSLGPRKNLVDVAVLRKELTAERKELIKYLRKHYKPHRNGHAPSLNGRR